MSPAGPDEILQIEAVSLAFGPRRALDAVSLTLRRGEIYALLGPNGAGKSTLVGVVCGRLQPDCGAVRLAGRDPFVDRQARAALGFAPQALALFPRLTVAENLDAFAHLAGLKGRAARDAVTEAMAVTHLADRARSQVRALSGGYQRRVNIAAAVLGRPKLIVLDEPTVGIDQSAREAIAEVLRELRNAGVCVLLVTHDLDQAGDLADRVGFLCEGAMRLEGSPAKLVADAFGEEMEVEVVLHGEAAGSERLREEGLAPASEAATWTCLAADGYGRAADLAVRLGALGLEAREIRVRRPSLAHLMARLAPGREFAA
ncbi:MAG TPA: ABC transporter ATP-binding protein [Caulobacteraceae bacterium]|nr:ABC transporter ATP-binding protein [Caulobacteraceae bacterium]